MTEFLRGAASSLIQHEPLRRRARSGGALLLEIRGWTACQYGRRRALRNVYGATIQKAGSQWTKALFNHECVRRVSGLATFPQFHYDAGEFRRRFPAYCFIPGLYLSYPEYQAIDKPSPYRTFYLARDPRDIVVSWYFSVRDTHRMMGRIGGIRRTLQDMTVSDGLLYSIEDLAGRLRGMGTWVDVCEAEVAFYRLEDFRERPAEQIRRLLEHCCIELTDEAFSRVLKDTSREALRNKDLQTRKAGEESHYRQRASRHADYFGDVHYAEFSAQTGDLVKRLGYS